MKRLLAFFLALLAPAALSHATEVWTLEKTLDYALAHTLGDYFPSQGTNTVFLDTGKYWTEPALPHPKDDLQRFYLFRYSSPVSTAVLNASGGKVSASSGQFWRIVLPSVPLLTLLLTVAVHRSKKPFVYAGFNNLNTDGHG